MRWEVDPSNWDALPAPVRPVEGTLVRGFSQTSPRAELPGALRVHLIGLLTTQADWDGVITIAGGGVHHWVHVSAGEAVSMMGFVTPALIETLGGADVPDEAAIGDTMSRPERLAAHLRSAQLAGDGAAVTGHLIGAELAAARMYWLGQQVAVLAERVSPYEAALKAQGVGVLSVRL